MDEQSLGLLGEEGAAPLGGEVQKQVTSGSGMQGRLSVIWCQVMLSASEQKKKKQQYPRLLRCSVLVASAGVQRENSQGNQAHQKMEDWA